MGGSFLMPSLPSLLTDPYSAGDSGQPSAVSQFSDLTCSFGLSQFHLLARPQGSAHVLTHHANKTLQAGAGAIGRSPVSISLLRGHCPLLPVVWSMGNHCFMYSFLVFKLNWEDESGPCYSVFSGHESSSSGLSPMASTGNAVAVKARDFNSLRSFRTAWKDSFPAGPHTISVTLHKAPMPHWGFNCNWEVNISHKPQRMHGCSNGITPP